MAELDLKSDFSTHTNTFLKVTFQHYALQYFSSPLVNSGAKAALEEGRLK